MCLSSVAHDDLIDISSADLGVAGHSKKERRAALLLHRCAKAARKAEALKRKEERRARKAEALEQELLSKKRHTATVLFKRHTATTNKRHTMRTQEAQEEAQEACYDVLADW